MIAASAHPGLGLSRSSSGFFTNRCSCISVAPSWPASTGPRTVSTWLIDESLRNGGSGLAGHFLTQLSGLVEPGLDETGVAADRHHAEAQAAHLARAAADGRDPVGVPAGGHHTLDRLGVLAVLQPDPRLQAHADAQIGRPDVH